MCKIVSSNVTTSQPTIISLCLEIKSNLTWSLFVHNRQVDENCAALSSVPKCLDVTSLSRLLSLLETMPVCPGHPDTHFLEMVDAKKGKLRGQSGNVVAFTDNYASVHLNGEFYPRTVRTASCELFVHGGKCSSCKEYRPHLRALFSRWSAQKQKGVSKFTNNQHLNTPQKQEKMKSLKARAQEAEKEVKRLQYIIEKSVEANGTAVDPNLHHDLVAIMEEKSHEIKENCLNGRNLTECKLRRKPELRPYRSPDDPRLQVFYKTSKCWTK